MIDPRILSYAVAAGMAPAFLLQRLSRPIGPTAGEMAEDTIVGMIWSACALAALRPGMEHVAVHALADCGHALGLSDGGLRYFVADLAPRLREAATPDPFEALFGPGWQERVEAEEALAAETTVPTLTWPSWEDSDG